MIIFSNLPVWYELTFEEVLLLRCPPLGVDPVEDVLGVYVHRPQRTDDVQALLLCAVDARSALVERPLHHRLARLKNNEKGKDLARFISHTVNTRI